jgi:hypothetical protein
MLPSSDRLGTIPISAFQGGQLPASYCPRDRGEGAAKTWRLGASDQDLRIPFTIDW